MKTKYKVITDEERCKGCALCVIYCPRKILKKSESYNTKGHHYVEVVNELKCSGCNFCYIICPDIAIGIKKEHIQDE